MTRRQNKAKASGSSNEPVTIEKVRRIALGFPGVEEGISNGNPVFRVRGKLIARLHSDEQSLLIKIDLFKREILLNAEPQAFFVTDFYRCHPMVFVRLSSVGSETIGDLIEQAWRLEAPKRLVELYDDRASLADTPRARGR